MSSLMRLVREMRFDGKVAVVVTGASRRIGKAIALALAEEGCNVVVNYKKIAIKHTRLLRRSRIRKDELSQ